jgi:hypothetical protein
MECEFCKIDKDLLKNNCFIVRVGSESRPASGEDMESFRKSMNEVFDLFDLDFKPSILITHHAVSFEMMEKNELKKLINKE